MFELTHRHIGLILLTASCVCVSADAQGHSLLGDIHQYYEVQGSVSEGKTPLWLNANRYGLSSLHEANGYVRAALAKETESILPQHPGKGLKVGYGMDIVLPMGYKDPNHTTHFILQQAYLDLQYGLGQLTIGSRQQPMELRDNRLSSGAQTLGINARPIPQIRLGLHDFWTLPYTRHWIGVKAHLAYGMMTDGDWQEDFTLGKGKRTKQVIYHQKAGYVRFGKPTRKWSLTLGLEMGSEIGGKAYNNTPDGSLIEYKTEQGIQALWHALTTSGTDVREQDIVYKNASGNHLGSWVARLDYRTSWADFGLYWDHYFEDHSSMFFLDYDGYGEGDQWDTHVHKRFYLYRPQDMQVGVDAHLWQTPWLQHVVLEWIDTRYQSGPVYHDHTVTSSEHISGQDDYYNHSTYAGWTHYGQVIGNPLYRSTIYNDDHQLLIEDNRFWALHGGIDGQLTHSLQYRLLLSYQEGLGTYYHALPHRQDNLSWMLECDYDAHALYHGLSLRLAVGMDRGELLGNNTGLQCTISYRL